MGAGVSRDDADKNSKDVLGIREGLVHLPNDGLVCWVACLEIWVKDGPVTDQGYRETLNQTEVSNVQLWKINEKIMVQFIYIVELDDAVEYLL